MVSQLRAAGYTVTLDHDPDAASRDTAFAVKYVDWASRHGFDVFVYRFNSASDLRRYGPGVVAATGRFPQANIATQAGHYLFVATSSWSGAICKPSARGFLCPPVPSVSKKLFGRLIATALAGND